MSLRVDRLPPHRTLAAALSLALLGSHASAQTEPVIWVTDGGDPDVLNPTTCSFRQALRAMHRIPTGTCVRTTERRVTVELAPWLVRSRIVLERGELVIDQRSTYPIQDRWRVRGHGVVLDARRASRVLRVVGSTAVELASMLDLEDLTLTAGRVGNPPVVPIFTPPQTGGGILVEQSFISLTLVRSRVVDNAADGAGGGIAMRGWFIPNGFYMGLLVLVDSTVDGNYGLVGGGLDMRNAGAILLRSTVSDNASTRSGAGIAAVHVHATGSDQAYKPLALWNSTVSGNAILNNEPGYYYSGSGIYQSNQDVELRHATISWNSGGDGQGFHDAAPGWGSLSVANSIVGGNGTDASEASRRDDPSTASGPALVTGTVTGSMFDSRARGRITGTGNLFGGDPQLGPLADNGGYVHTMRPLAGSPLIDAGDDVTCTTVPALPYPILAITLFQSLDTVPYDARLGERPQGAHCDIGAFEVRQGSFAIAASVTGQGRVDALPLPTGTGSNGGIVQCTSAGGAGCNATFVGENDASTLWFTATPAAGWHLAGWSGDCMATLIDPQSARLSIDGTRSCNAAFAIDTHAIGGFVQGLVGSGLALRLNGGDAMPIAADGRFAFEAPLDHGTPYSITVATQPTGQICTVTEGSGVADGTMQDTAVMCSVATMPATVSITIDDGTTLIGHGPTPGYTITVRNDGDEHAYGVVVTTAATPAVALEGLSWSCDLACSPSGGAGHVATRIDVGAHDQRTVHLRGSIVPFPGGTLSVMAQVAIPPWYVDTSGVHSAVDTNIVDVIFRGVFD